tara:strand:- start:15937 stop:17031 length:1095 start_codon:yes stop_codon:yes gene_type:complete
MISKQIALDALKLQQQVGLEDSKVPVLVGKTSSGKTYWIQNELSKALDLPVVKILLQNETQDEVLGFPKYLDSTNSLTYLKPAWWSDTPSIFFFDELDKSRDDLHASILTLMREGTVRGRPLPKGSVIIAAMNETDNLSEPLKARSLFLPFVYEERSSSLNDVVGYLQDKWTLSPTLPEPSQCMENVHYLERYQTVRPTLSQEPGLLSQICQGLFPADTVPSIIDMIVGVQELDYAKLLDKEETFNNFVHTQRSVDSAAKHIVEFIKVGKYVSHASMVVKLYEKFASTNADDLVRLYSQVHDIFFDNYPNLSRHEFSTEFVQALGKKLGAVLGGYTSAIDDLAYSWEVEDANSQSESTLQDSEL